MGAFELHGAVEEESGEGAVEERALPRVVDDRDWIVMEDDCGEPKERDGEEQDADGWVQAGAAV